MWTPFHICRIHPWFGTKSILRLNGTTQNFTLISPFGERAEDMTDDDRSRQSAEVAYPPSSC